MLKPFNENFEQAVNEIVADFNKTRGEGQQIDTMMGIVLMQDIFTAMILSLYDYAARLASTEETYQLLLDPQYKKSLANTIQQCLILYQFDDYTKLGRMIESIYDNTNSKSVKFMMHKIARTYLIRHDVSYVHYGQTFIDKFFLDRKKLISEKGKLKLLP